jgi:hypothetical protein
MAARVYHFGNPIEVVFTQEALVDPAFRGRGIARSLQAKSVEPSERPMLSLWHNQKILSLIQSEGWLKLGSFRTMKKIYRADRIVASRSSLPLSGIMGSVANALLRLGRSLSSVRRPTTTNALKAVELSRFDRRADDLFTRVAQETPYLCERTQDILNWRFVDIPHKRYTVLEAPPNGPLEAYAVCRIQHADGLRKGIIADILAEDENAARSVIAACDDLFTRQGVDFAVCHGMQPAVERAFRSLRYRPARPLPIDSLWVHSSQPLPDADHPGAWHVTLADSDGEMW